MEPKAYTLTLTNCPKVIIQAPYVPANSVETQIQFLRLIYADESRYVSIEKKIINRKMDIFLLYIILWKTPYLTVCAHKYIHIMEKGRYKRIKSRVSFRKRHMFRTECCCCCFVYVCVFRSVITVRVITITI